jgi:catabolite repression HPr-like protein
MIKTSVVVKADPGFDGRPIALLVQEASQYASKVYIQVAEKNINAKSIMGMMSLNLIGGEEITVVTDGEDEQLKALRHFLLTYNNNKMVIEVTER